VKILGVGELKAKLAFEVAAASKSAVAAIWHRQQNSLQRT
jgi:large subunit ribosomal protein L15